MSENKDWERTQQKTFTKWTNNHLRKKGFAPIEDPAVDFETGIKLMQIVNALYDIPIPKHNAAPKLRPNKLDNIELALKMVEQAKIKTNFLKHTHLVDHDLKMILGMIWAIILDYAIKGISVEEMTAKEGLLLWCRKKTAGYREVDPPGIQNFTTSWKNGMGFCALIHKHLPQLIDYDSLQASEAAANLELAFATAATALNVPRLLDVEDLLAEKPDERSVMTYVAELFHALASLDQKQASARRAAKFMSFIRRVEASKADYEARATSLLEWIETVIASWQQPSAVGDTVESAQAAIDLLRTFTLKDEPEHAALKLDLEALFVEIQTELRVNGRAPYSVPSAVSPDALEAAFAKLYAARQSYARKARDNRFTFIQKQEVTSLNEEQVKEFKEAFAHFSGGDGRLSTKEELKAAMSAVGVNLGTDSELVAAFAQLSASSGGEGGVNEESFTRELISLREDKDTPEQIKASFKQLANGKDTILAEDLNIGQLQPDAAAFAALLPKAADGSLDYNAFVDSNFLH